MNFFTRFRTVEGILSSLKKKVTLLEQLASYSQVEAEALLTEARRLESASDMYLENVAQARSLANKLKTLISPE